MATLHLGIAAIPMSLYVLFLGIVNLRRRPTVVHGAVDRWWLGLGLMGLAISGPMQLFLPETAADRFGPWVWLLLCCLYMLVLILVSLSMRPRLVIYNATPQEISEPLVRAARQADPQATHTGTCLSLPTLGVQFYQDPYPPLRNVQLIATHRDQSVEAWQQFHQLARQTVGNIDTRRPWYALWMVAGATSSLTMVAMVVYQNQAATWEALRDFLRIS